MLIHSDGSSLVVRVEQQAAFLLLRLNKSAWNNVGTNRRRVSTILLPGAGPRLTASSELTGSVCLCPIVA